MRNAIGLSIIVMMLCFNIGMFIVDTAGLYKGTSMDYESPDVYDPTEEYSVNLIGLLGTMGLLSVLAGIGAIVGKFAGIDPLRSAAIFGFVGFIATIFNSTYKVLTTFAADIGGSLAMTIVLVFMVVQVIFVMFFVYQLATQGWQSHI